MTRKTVSARRELVGRRLWSGLVLPAPIVVISVISTGDPTGLLEIGGGGWPYVMVFVLAAVPWWEVLLVVPPAIGIGLNPVAVAVLAFLGNVLPVYLIIAVHGRVTSWLERRRRGEEEKSKRAKRANRLFQRYGLGGVALVAPVAIGIHLATAIVLVLNSQPRSVAAWMTASVALWTVVLTVSSVVGFGLLGII